MDKGPLRVLLVEDDPDDYLLTRELLEEIPGNKIALDWAKNFEEGLVALDSCEHDAFLLDYRLGKKDGLALLREAFLRGCRAPIILLTGGGDRDLALQALEAGAADYLVKGEIDAASLERSIRYALQQKQHALELQDKVTARTAELEEANASLRESEERFRTLFASTPMAVFVCDRDATVQYYNRRAVELWGREPRCGVEQHCGSAKLRLPDGTLLPHTQSPIVEVLRTGIPAFNVEVVIERPDGSRLPVLVNFAALKNAAGEITGAITSFIDITERKRAEEALRESETQIRALFEAAEAARLSAEAAKSRAEAATRAKDNFLAALSHELRTPLNPALLLATSLAEDTTLPPQVRSDIDVIAKGIALQSKLIDDLLDITRITGGKLRLDLRPIDAHAALRHAHDILRTDIQEREIKFTLDLAATRQTIKADAVRLQQIFWNVLKNAVKFTPRGGSVTVRTCNPPEKPDALEVEVIDAGIGIAPEMLHRVFDAFVQEEDNRGHRFGGIGLGLAITQRLVELQKGRIVAESPGRGHGATFRIELPLDTAAPISDSAFTAGLPTAPAQAPRRILLVEDHEQTRSTLLQLLQRRRHIVEGVATTEAARERVAAGDYDLIISDLGLPDGDGHRLMAELHDNYGLPGIALSGYGMDHDIARSRASGFFAHLTKPVDIRALESAIAAAPHPVLARQESPSELQPPDVSD